MFVNGVESDFLEVNSGVPRPRVDLRSGSFISMILFMQLTAFP